MAALVAVHPHTPTLLRVSPHAPAPLQMDVRVADPTVGELVLDTSGLTIHAAQLLPTAADPTPAQPLNFRLGEPHKVGGGCDGRHGLRWWL